MINSKTCSMVGIDHGTTYSCVAIFRNDQVQVIDNEEGQRITPSVVHYPPNGGPPVVGDVAYARLDSVNTFFDTKRLLGKGITDEAVEQLSRFYNFSMSNPRPDSTPPHLLVQRKQPAQSQHPMLKLCPSTASTVGAPQNPPNLRPLEVCSRIMAKMAHSAELLLNNSSNTQVQVHRAVIAVPAKFSDKQRQETIEAARLAGLTDVDLISEPVAAAVAYGYDSGKFDGYTLLVYDLGGGTFDVTVIKLVHGEFKVLSLDGKPDLGGRDFDNALLTWALDKIRQDYGVDFSNDFRVQRQLLTLCEKAKKDLSRDNYTSIYIGELSPRLAERELSISRAEFVSLIAPLVEETITITKRALATAKPRALQTRQINEIFLSGGSTRVQLVQEMLQEMFPNKRLNKSINGDLVVAHGAALRAAQLCSETKGCLPKMTISQKTALSLGVKSVEGMYDIVLPRMSALGAKKVKHFTTIVNDQTNMELDVYEGERPIAEHNNYLGTLFIDGIRKDMATSSSVAVTFHVNKNGILEVEGRTDKREPVAMRFTQLTAPSVAERLVDEAEKNKEKDVKAHARANALSDLKVAIEKVVYGIPVDESRRTSQQSSLVKICQEYRLWVEKSESSSTVGEKRYREKLALFNEEWRKAARK